MSNHSSDAKAAVAQIEGTRDVKLTQKWITHKTDRFQWWPSNDGPYCAKDARSPWMRASQTDVSCGCRRPYGEGTGFCNADTQTACSRSSACICGVDEKLLPPLTGQETRRQQVGSRLPLIARLNHRLTTSNDCSLVPSRSLAIHWCPADRLLLTGAQPIVSLSDG